MGKTILTSAQHYVLQAASESVNINNWFYLTGGTALAEFYLQHRLSEDLDFFSEDNLNTFLLDEFIQTVGKDLKAQIQKETHMGMVIYKLQSKNATPLKIDFVYQPFKQLEFGKKYKNIRISSLWDIIVDKLYTIFNRLTARDFVDLYFGMKELDCNIDQLIKGLEEKYEMRFEKITLLSRLPAVKDVSDYPKMIVPFDQKEMENFFLKMTKDLEKEIFR